MDTMNLAHHAPRQTWRQMPDDGTLDLDRLRLLRDSVIDLSICIDDIDAELEPRLAARVDLDTRLREAEHELAELLRRLAA